MLSLICTVGNADKYLCVTSTVGFPHRREVAPWGFLESLPVWNPWRPSVTLAKHLQVHGGLSLCSLHSVCCRDGGGSAGALIKLAPTQTQSWCTLSKEQDCHAQRWYKYKRKTERAANTSTTLVFMLMLIVWGQFLDTHRSLYSF